MKFTGKTLKIDQKSASLNNKKKHKIFFKKFYLKWNITFVFSYQISLYFFKNKKCNIKQLQHVYKKLKFNLKKSYFRPKKFLFESNLYFTHACTRKPKDLRMGRGKGVVYAYVANFFLGKHFLSMSYFSYNFCHWFLQKTLFSLFFKYKILQGYNYW